MSGREPAWRLLAFELLASIEEERATVEKAASYVISPLGARVNRALMAGTLGPPESVGRSESTPFLRAKLTDPTGTVSVTAGSFQPRALAALQRVSTPGPHLVVGKANLYRGRDGVAYPSLRLEASLRLDDARLRSAWAEIASDTVDRFELQRRVRRSTPPTESALIGDGVPPRWAAAALAARDRYPSLAPDGFRPAIEAALAAIGAPTAVPPGPVTIRRSAPPPLKAELTAEDRAKESAFLDIVDELADASTDGYADLGEAIERAGSRGIPSATAEELLNRLEETGALEEPIVGKLRRA